MPDLVTHSPLLLPIEWQGYDYLSSHYFHHQYLANSPDGGKYREHKHFRDTLRRMENYALHCQNHDIIELAWDDVKSGPADILGRFKPLFAATGYYPLILLNAAAQISLTHHLDDEVSKHLSVGSSKIAARQMTPKSLSALPEEIAVRKLDAYLQLGRLLHTPEHIVQQEAVKQIEVSTGVNLRPLLLAAPAQSTIAPDEEMLEPRDLAKQLGLPSAIALNRALEQIGWQIKQIGGSWEPTPTGAPYAARHAWTAEHGAKSGYNTKWRRQAVENALRSAGVLPLHVQTI